MRFSDTQEGWNAELLKIRSNVHITNFLKAISSEPIEIVEASKSHNRPIAMCHDNVRQHVVEHGGEHVFGWMLRPSSMFEHSNFDGMFLAVFHSNWRNPSGKLISITDETSNFHLFLPDKIRKYNFEINESYNNRVIYLDDYKPTFNGLNPSRNVNYFFAGGYADRDRRFEKYRIPKSREEIGASIPESMKKLENGEIVLLPDGIKWAALKFAISPKR